ncbi:MAG TPA: MotA/TolQ/ExbB proton channel family protein, partial [bacterium]|nr:MotA/TolQ/ExbB proton channel family protein [bacterium]
MRRVPLSMPAAALITTAAGLILAIPCMGFFFYFRGKLQSRIGQMEELAVELSEQMAATGTAAPAGRRGRHKPPAREPVE